MEYPSGKSIAVRLIEAFGTKSDPDNATRFYKVWKDLDSDERLAVTLFLIWDRARYK